VHAFALNVLAGICKSFGVTLLKTEHLQKVPPLNSRAIRDKKGRVSPASVGTDQKFRTFLVRAGQRAGPLLFTPCVWSNSAATSHARRGCFTFENCRTGLPPSGRLAESLGVTFQQVQKYEKGTNRVGSGRLYQISTVLYPRKRTSIRMPPAASPSHDLRKHRRSYVSRPHTRAANYAYVAKPRAFSRKREILGPGVFCAE